MSPRRALSLAVLVLAALLVPVAPAGAAPAAPPPPAVSPCQFLPVVVQPACYAREEVGAVLEGDGGFIGNSVGAVADAFGNSAMEALTAFVVEGAVWFLTAITEAVTSSTTVAVTSTWFTEHYTVMTGLAAMFALLFLLLSAAGTVFHQDPGRLARAVVAVGIAGLGTAAATTVTQLLLVVSDELSVLIAGTLVGDLEQAMTGATRNLSDLTLITPVPAFATLIAGIVAAFAAVLIWVELLLRGVAIYATLLFFPIALAGLAWEPSRRWARRLAELLTALIFAKFVIVAILSLAAGALAAGGEGYAGVLSGAALLLVAAFAPFLLLRVIGVFEVAVAAGALEGARQRGTRPVTHGGQTAMYAVQRHRALSAHRGVTVAAAAPWAAAGALAAGGAAAGRSAAGAATGTLAAIPPAGSPASPSISRGA
ncbi:MAG: hypothetical protein WD794_13195 [Mycobacteriales bacterium]